MDGADNFDLLLGVTHSDIESDVPVVGLLHNKN